MTKVFKFFEIQIEFCKSNDRLGTARNYERTLSSFKKFLDGEDINFEQIDSELVQRYEKWLLDKGVVRNSSSFYMRNLRSIYNKAVKTNHSIFSKVYTGVDKTQKRAVSEDIIYKLAKMKLKAPLELTRDLFLFSYCTRGMSFVDIAFLKKSDIKNGIITYIRRKTGKKLSIKIEPCISKIINKYANTNSPYIFPIITAKDPQHAYNQYQTALNYHNRKLKILGEDLSVNLSSYTARHTWASSARRHNIPLSVISESMGHSSDRITQIYLTALENSLLDEANSEILRRLNSMVSL